ncbi:hypothetical protein ACFOLC_15810 [Lysobacter cavernae]|uniref:Uncharacterized protein n=1 Tax=Lysobacter cavernae TaxID=1685901 RepID=A0ABV7RWX9_9GAMM
MKVNPRCISGFVRLTVAHNNSFKPNLLRYIKYMTGKACHVFASATQVGLTQALGLMEDFSMTTNNTARFKPLAIIFLVSLIVAIGLGFFGPRLLAPLGPAGSTSYNPLWLVYTSWAFGLIAVVTVPFAWRWLYRRHS